MKDKVQRIGKMFNSKTKKSVMIPMDHGILGIPPGLEDPVKSFKGFVELGADAILLNIGILKLVREYLNSLKKVPGIILAIDYNLRWPKWKIPIETDCIIAHCIKHDIELALKYGADAIKIYFALGLEPRLQFNYIKNICKIVNECDKYNMPVMIEPVTEEKYISQNKKGDPEIIADGCRIALELGADILKVPFPSINNPKANESFKMIFLNSHVPVIVLGGPKKAKSLLGIMNTAREAIDAGASGTIFGRNVWQRPKSEMERAVKALKDIVHKGDNPINVMSKYNLN